jgi:hypothetical protein
MTDIDDRIRAGLDADDRDFLASLDRSRGLFTQIGDTLGGPLGGCAKLVYVVSVFLAAFTFFAAWSLLTAEETRQLILWAVAVVVAVVMQGFIKDWFFSRMNMLSILREVKRLQVQVAMLGGSESPGGPRA